MQDRTAIVFDLDGTLIHSAPDLHAAANRMLSDLQRDPLTLEQVTSFVGNGVPKLVERCLAATGGGAPDAEQIFRHHYDANPATLTEPYPGAVALLEALRRDERPLGICTNKPEGPTRAILAALDLGRFFGAVVGGDTLAVKKPDPAPLLECFQRLGVKTALYVGDSETDAATAQAADVPFALFTQGYRKTPAEDLPADYRFDVFADLARYLEVNVTTADGL